jgi:hypothetical protein
MHVGNRSAEKVAAQGSCRSSAAMQCTHVQFGRHHLLSNVITAAQKVAHSGTCLQTLAPSNCLPVDSCMRTGIHHTHDTIQL